MNTTIYENDEYDEDIRQKSIYIANLKNKYPEDKNLWEDSDFNQLFDYSYQAKFIKPLLDEDSLYVDVKKGYYAGKLKIVVICPKCNISATTIETCSLMTADISKVKCFLCRSYEGICNYIFNSSK